MLDPDAPTARGQSFYQLFLIGVELAFCVLENCYFPDSRRISNMRRVLARDPLLTDHAIEHFTRNPRRSFQRLFPRLLACRKIIEHAELRVLLIGCSLRPSRGPCASCQ